MQFRTFINCQIPRIKSSKEVKTIKVPWANNYERHSYLFEGLCIDLLKATKNQTQTAKLLRCGFNVVNRIIHCSVDRGMNRRPKDVAFTNLSLDEKSFRKGHNYVTVLSSPLTGCIIDISEGRDIKAAKSLLQQVVKPEHRDSVETVSVDMWKAYLSSV
ncbi:MAG: transposase [Flavobacteriaceae bacterium]|nr:transposase [Flavobacteriaceae bacterium]